MDLYEMKVCSRVMVVWVEITREARRRQYGLVMKAVCLQRRQEFVVCFSLKTYILGFY